ncbi:MAG: aldose epimerase family protein [Chitinispirillia bacterium]|jgi:aldose 1-epimerase
MSITKVPFGEVMEEPVFLYTLSNQNNMTVKITDYGGIVTSIQIPDKNGIIGEVVLGFENFENYLGIVPYFGALIGRYGNRIANGRFTLDGIEFKLAVNNGPNHLHGGIRGFDKVVWNSGSIEGKDYEGVRLTYLSVDGEEGYPGNLDVTVSYKLNPENELKIEYSATCDKSTPVNLTHHGYFNLRGKGNILGHILTIHADHFTPVDKNLIPTGEITSVKNTPMDFTSPTVVGKRIYEVNGGYDHNYVLNGWDGSIRPVASLFDRESGRKMDVLTTEPGMQFYTGNFLNGSLKGSGGRVFDKNAGLCLETQHYPDSPNRESFPTTILRPGQQYCQTTVYRFHL